jgi:hypothetical protein
MRRFRWFLTCLLTTAACGGGDPVTPPDGGGPGTPLDTIVTFSGSDQLGFTDTELELLVTATVKLSTGQPLANVPVRFRSASSFDATATTGTDGTAFVRWKLGSNPGRQSLAVQVAQDAELPAAITAFATAKETADVIIVRGMTEGTLRILILDPVSIITYRRVYPDTILMLQPLNRESLPGEVLIFANKHAPSSRMNPWTTSPDTLNFALTGPVQIPITLWFVDDSATSHRRAMNEINSAQAIFDASSLGVRIGRVTIRNASQTRSEFEQFSCGQSLSIESPGEINMYYLPFLIFTAATSPALTCTGGRIVEAPTPFANIPALLAHELGHSFGMTTSAVPGNLMRETFTGNSITIGQIMAAHFGVNSSLSRVFGRTNQSMRGCGVAWPRCLDQSFDFGN